MRRFFEDVVARGKPAVRAETEIRSPVKTFRIRRTPVPHGTRNHVAERSSVETASSFMRRLHDLFASLVTSPSAGTIGAGLEREGVRKFPMGNYLIYYRARQRVTIWGVLHGERLQLCLLRGGRA